MIHAIIQPSMDYPKYLYRGTTTNYLGPRGLIGTNPRIHHIYFADNPAEAAGYAYLHMDDSREDTVMSFLRGGRPVMVVVKIDPWLRKRLEQGWESDSEWLVRGGFVPRENIVQVYPMPNVSWRTWNYRMGNTYKWPGLVR
jgi:hypothetical protein